MNNYSQSKIKHFRRCQKAYAFRYDYPVLFGGTDRHELVPRTKRLPLYRGTWLHALQEALHKQWAYGAGEYFKVKIGEGKKSLVCEVKSWRELQDILKKQYDELFDEEKEELGDLPGECERLFKSYLRFWQDDRERYEVAEFDGVPAVEYMIDVSFPKSWGQSGIFKGRVDLLVYDEEYEGLWIWDAKWVKTIPDPDERMMSPQALLYKWGIERQTGEKVVGFLYNYGRTKAPVIPQVLKRPANTLSMRRNMDTDIYTYLAAIKDLHGEDYRKYLPYYREHLKLLKGREVLWFRRERIPVEEDRVQRALREMIVTAGDIENRDQKDPPRSYFFNCKFGCDYHELCVAEFGGLDITPLVKANYEVVGERYGADDLLSA